MGKSIMHGLAVECMKAMSEEDRLMCCKAGIKYMQEHNDIDEDFSREVVDFYNKKYLKMNTQ